MISNLDSNIMQLHKVPQFELIFWYESFVETHIRWNFGILCSDTTIKRSIWRLFWWIIMNCFCGLTNRRKVLHLISSQDHHQRFSQWSVSSTPWAAFKPVQNVRSDFAEWSYAVDVTTTSRRHKLCLGMKLSSLNRLKERLK